MRQFNSKYRSLVVLWATTTERQGGYGCTGYLPLLQAATTPASEVGTLTCHQRIHIIIHIRSGSLSEGNTKSEKETGKRETREHQSGSGSMEKVEQTIATSGQEECVEPLRRKHTSAGTNDAGSDRQVSSRQAGVVVLSNKEGWKR